MTEEEKRRGGGCTGRKEVVRGEGRAEGMEAAELVTRESGRQQKSGCKEATGGREGKVEGEMEECSARKQR